MKPFDEMTYNPTAERLVEILSAKTQNNNPLFFRVIVGYYFCKLASAMRASIATHDRGDIPVNMYALNLSPSGTGKGVSTGIMENTVMARFIERFKTEVFPVMAETNLPKLSLKRATRKGTDPDDELAKSQKEFEDLGPLLMDFSEATPPAVKQMRQKLLMAGAGSVSLEIDEIGANLLSSLEVLNTFLELFDVGRIKQKLTKNTTDSKRSEEIIGNTPTNLLMFGAPSKLLNGAKTEEELYAMFETGYARRCFFGFARSANKMLDVTAEQLYDLRTKTSTNQFLEDLATQLEMLADVSNVGRKLEISKETTLILLDYQLQCERKAAKLPEHDDMKKAEISHRYFKALKLAGAYAFIANSAEVTTEHLYQAIKLAEESGEAFANLLTRDRPYVKLAKYMAAVGKEVTQADLVEDLPFYRGGSAQKSEMLTLAIAWGYRNNIIIKKTFNDGIEFLRGEALEETNLNEMVVSWSQDIVEGYKAELAPWDKMNKLTQAQGLHWVNHHLSNGYRNEESAIPGFNMVVIDMDGGVNISTVKMLMKDYKFLIYTTKRHTEEEHRFRLVFPMSHKLKLNAQEYREFMENVMEWLPFEGDTSTNQRARKWLSNAGQFETNEGKLLDALPFIPKTAKNADRKALLNSQASMDNLERWAINNIGDGNRNNMLLRYALILLDAGFDLEKIRSKVMDLNSKIPDKLTEVEILTTVMVTVSKRIMAKMAGNP